MEKQGKRDSGIAGCAVGRVGCAKGRRGGEMTIGLSEVNGVDVRVMPRRFEGKKVCVGSKE